MSASHSDHTPRFGTVHRILVFTASLQRIPAWGMLLLFALMALPVAAVWPESDIPLLVIMAAEVNALSLLLLPLMDRSHGPDRATALALALVCAASVTLFGLLGLPAWLAMVWLTGLTMVAIYSTWVEPFWLEVTIQRKSIAGWDGRHPLRLLHLSDLHAEHFGPRERHLNRVVAALKPDVIVFTGDFINLSNVSDPDVRAVVRQVVAGWHAPLGVYAVSGTSPEIDLPEDVPAYLSEAENAHTLVGAWTVLDTPGGTLNIGGLATWHDMATDLAAFGTLMRSAPSQGAHVLLVHTPDLAPEAIEAGIDLYLCGHTHGGQLCLPGGIPLLTASLLGWRFARGRVDVGLSTVYTSRGIGMEGLGAPRARLFCRPEITLWEITQ